MASAAAIPIQKALFSALFILSVASILASGFQFQVGEEMAWKKPIGKERETYNEWAAQHRFHIGDTLHFQYANDSVVVVSQGDYRSCSASNPIAKFEGGSTVYELERAGCFYFISGQPSHCKSGQRLIVCVMHPLPAAAPEIPPSQSPSPSPASSGERGGSGDGSDLPGSSSAAEVAVVPFSVAAVAGLLVAFYLFV